MLLAYVFITFILGIACLGALIEASRRREAGLTRAFLVFYAAFSVLVLGRLLLAFVLEVPGTGGAARGVVEYLESIVGRYGVLFALPFFAHRLFGVAGGARDRVLAAVTLVAVAGQHVTEFGLGGALDGAGDVAEDVLFAGVVVYILVLGFGRLGSRGVVRPVATRFLAVLVGGAPVIAHDLFLGDGTSWRFYPLWYCVVGIVMTVTLALRHPGLAPGGSGEAARGWGLTAQEERVLGLVRRGLSTREIARALSISPNTVKTHLRAIFDKSGHRSRVGLLAAMAARPADHPIG